MWGSSRRPNTVGFSHIRTVGVTSVSTDSILSRPIAWHWICHDIWNWCYLTSISTEAGLTSGTSEVAMKPLTFISQMNFTCFCILFNFPDSAVAKSYYFWLTSYYVHFPTTVNSGTWSFVSFECLKDEIERNRELRKLNSRSETNTTLLLGVILDMLLLTQFVITKPVHATITITKWPDLQPSGHRPVLVCP